MQVNGPSHLHGAHGVNGPHYNRNNSPQANQASAAPSDQLDISPAALEAFEAQERGEIRTELVARVRQQIADGTYETPDKLNAALDAALDHILDEIG